MEPCDEKVEAAECPTSEADDIVTIDLHRKNLCFYSLVGISIGFCMIPLTMSSPHLSVIFPLLSSLLIMGGLSVYVWSRFGAWWE